MGEQAAVEPAEQQAGFQHMVPGSSSTVVSPSRKTGSSNSTSSKRVKESSSMAFAATRSSKRERQDRHYNDQSAVPHHEVPYFKTF